MKRNETGAVGAADAPIERRIRKGNVEYRGLPEPGAPSRPAPRRTRLGDAWLRGGRNCGGRD